MAGAYINRLHQKFDQCMYDLRVPGLRTNMMQLRDLAVSCNASHCHTHCYGTTRHNNRVVSVSKLAGQYPPSLCARWAEAVAQAAEARFN